MVSVVTTVRGRLEHLARVAAGIARTSPLPAEWIVVAMGGPDPAPVVEETPVPVQTLSVPGEDLPLAAARNAGAAAARGDLVFLDVDCVPAPGTFGAYEDALARTGAPICGRTLYLPPDCQPDLNSMAARGLIHPHQEELFGDEPAEDRRHELFWSLNFGLRAETFQRLEGFDERYTGYGVEDTDFAYRVRESGLPVVRDGRALAFHQYHQPSAFDPENLDALIANVLRFRDRWGEWPAPGWLEDLRRTGEVRWDPEQGVLERT